MFCCIRTLQLKKTDWFCLLIAAGLIVYSLLDWWFFPMPGIRQREISNPYFTTMDREGNTYIINDGKSEVLKISGEKRILARMSRDSHEEDAFGEANELAVDEAGNIYVSDVLWNDTGLGMSGERILRYDSGGHFDSVVFEADYSEQMVMKRHLFSLKKSGDGVVFAAVDPTGEQFRIYEIGADESEARELQCIKWENVESVQYIAVASGEMAYVIDKRGNIFWTDGANQKAIYHNADHEYILPYQAAMSEDGTVYVTDICNQMIYQIRDGGMEPLYDAETLSELTGIISENSVLEQVGVASVGERKMLCITADTGCGVIAMDSGDYQGLDAITYQTGIQWMLLSRYVAGVAAGLICLYYLMAGVRYLFKSGILKKKRTSLILILGVSVASLVVLFSMLSQFRETYIDEQIQSICTVAQIASNMVDPEAFSKVQYPADYQSESYRKLQKNMEQLIDTSSQYSGNMYCNLAKMEDGRCYAFAYLDNSIGAYYPLDEHERSEIEKVYEDGEIYINDGKSDATGSYVYAKAPIFSGEDQVIGVVEIGMVSDTLTGIVEEMRTKIMVNILLMLVVCVFILNEGFAFSSDWKLWRNAKKEARTFSLPYLRILIFLCSLAYNMPTSFLPVYVGKFYTEEMPFSEAIASSLPLTVNFAMIGIMAVFCTGLMRRMGFCTTMIMGSLCCLCGDISMAMAGNYWMVAGGLLLNGTGCGLLMNGLPILVAEQEGKVQEDGFAVINGSMLSGMMCGTVIGAVLAEHMGESNMFFVSGGLWLGMSILVMAVGRYFKMKHREKEKTNQRGTMRAFWSWEILGFLILVLIPYVIVNGFTSYFLPMFGDSYGLSESQTSLLLVMNCLVGVFLGRTLTEICMKKLGKFSIVLSSILSLGAVLLFAYFQNLYMLAFTLFVLGAAKSFGSTVRSLIYCMQPKVEEIGADRAMGYYNFADNMGESLGTVTFGAILGIGLISGMWIFAGISAVMLGVFGVAKKMTDM